MDPRFSFSKRPLDLPALQQPLHQQECGGYASFEGWVRNHNEGLAVTSLDYEAFEALAVKEGERIIAEACERFGVSHARCVHRVGELSIGDIAVWVGVSAPHRDEAFRACRYIIDEVKHRVPIWKKEHYVNGDSGWVNCERCATAPLVSATETLRRDRAHDGHDHHGHDDHAHHNHGHHDHSHGDHAHHNQTNRQPVSLARQRSPDYSRQTALAGVGAAGQQRLRAARVVVIGAGGLGVPALQYLAGAGIGHLRIIDGDRLDPSNLHRQTLYTLADCGQAKAELAASRLRALNPDVHIDAHEVRLDAHNGAALLADADLVLECSDNFRTKFLLNDLCQQLGKTVIFASVYQFEGQLQVLRPADRSSCLRCIWPEATRDGIVGNCAEAGVLGPVPGVLGSLQALEAMKILLNLPGQLRDELLLLDLTTLSSQRLRAKRRSACSGSSCEASNAALVAVQTVGPSGENLELQFSALNDALDAGYALIDIRESEELRVLPTPARDARHLPLAELLAGSNLPPGERYLLVCGRGQRSLGAAQALRARGLSQVYSLRGGVLGLALKS